MSNDKPTPRLRVVGWRVQPIVMLDDGDNLAPVPVQAVEIPATEWDGFKAGGDEQALQQVADQVLPAADA